MKILRRHFSRTLFTSSSLVLSIFLLSCEEVIELDLSDIENQIVIEGTVSNMSSGSEVRVSFATSAFKKSQPRPTSGAVVTLSDDVGNSEILRESQSGIYVSSRITGVPHRTYTLRVELDRRVYSGVSTMPLPMTFDSIHCTAPYGNPQFPNPLALKYYITNTPGVDEYCLIKAYHPNDTNVFWTVYSDEYSDGKQVALKGPTFYSASTNIMVDLISIDKATYEYFYSLRQLIGDDDVEVPDLLSINEYNPKSNLTNNALGYFSAQARRSYVLTRR
jgi:hypothetical protein